MASSLYSDPRNPGQKEVYTTPKPAPAGSRSIVHGGKHSPRGFDVGCLDAEEIKHVLEVVVGHGDNVCFTLTSDGGALSTTVVQGGLRHKVYGSTEAQVYQRWSVLLDTLY